MRNFGHATLSQYNDITQSIIFFFFYREFFAWILYLYEILIIVAYHDLQSIGETWCTVQHDEEPKCWDIIEISHSCLKQFYRRKCFQYFFLGEKKSIKKIFIDTTAGGAYVCPAQRSHVGKENDLTEQLFNACHGEILRFFGFEVITKSYVWWIFFDLKGWTEIIIAILG